MAGLELNPDCNEVTASGTFGYILLYLDDKPSMRWRFNKTMKLKLVWEISELSSKIEKVKSAFSFNQYKLPLDHASEINQEGKGKHINAELFENETVDAQGSKPTRVHSVTPQRRPKMPPQNRSGETSLYENDNDNDDDFDMASENDKSSKTETVHVSEIDLPKHFQNMHGSEHESSVNAGIHSSINSQIPGPSTQIKEYKGSELYGSIETKTICDNFGLEKKKQVFTLDSRAKQGTLVEGNQNMGSKRSSAQDFCAVSSTGRKTCKFCKKWVSSKREHFEAPRKKLKCSSCPCFLPSHADLIVHQHIIHNGGGIEGDEASESSNINRFSRANIKDTGKNVRCSKKFYSCPVCGIKLQNCHLVNHVKNKHTKEDVFICCYCKKPLSNHSMLADHIKFHLGIETKKGKLHCSLCPSVFTSASAFHRHSHTHRTVCVFCNKDFGFLRLLQDHYKKEHWEEMFPCRVCGHRLATKRQHWTHERHHKYSNGDPCHICGKVFVDMKLHLAYHEKSGDNNEADSNTTASLINNGGAVIDSEKHLCTMCPSTFPTEGFLVRHMTTIHKQDMGLKCPQCPKRFGTRKQLASHVKRHVDRKEKKFVCSVCEKIFAENHTLKMHMRVHDLEKFLTCSICDKGFNYKVTYKTHMKTKHGVDI